MPSTPLNQLLLRETARQAGAAREPWAAIARPARGLAAERAALPIFITGIAITIAQDWVQELGFCLFGTLRAA